MASRVDHAARLLLSHMAFLEHLAPDDHTALCALPAPHGPLFAWLEAQFMEHGPLAWAVLRESLRGHECETLAVKVMTGAHAQTEGDVAELRAELSDLLTRIQLEQIKEQLSAASASGDLALWRELDARSRTLKAALEPAAPK
jgi:DNA primase